VSVGHLRKRVRRAVQPAAWRVQRRWPVVRNRTDVLNFLVAANGYRTYLEIGVRNPGGNFSRVRVAEKTGVDPAATRGAVDFAMTSDDFFAGLDAADADRFFDLVFVDGLHVDEQVERDIVNGLRHLSDSGAVVVHDCNPTARDAQTNAPSRALWLGTVWKAWAKLRSTRPDLAMAVVDVDLGCGVIMPGQQECYPLAFESYDALDYAVLEGDRRRLLNLISAREFMTRYSGQRP